MPFPLSSSECCGALEHYDKAFDRITTRNEKLLKSIKRIFHTVTTTDDPVIRKVSTSIHFLSTFGFSQSMYCHHLPLSLFVSQHRSFCLQLAKTQGNVFATDAILATLMCCTRSVNSWDIIVQRVGNKLFFDKRDNSDFGEISCHLVITDSCLSQFHSRLLTSSRSPDGERDSQRAAAR